MTNVIYLKDKCITIKNFNFFQHQDPTKPSFGKSFEKLMSNPSCNFTTKIHLNAISKKIDERRKSIMEEYNELMEKSNDLPVEEKRKQIAEYQMESTFIPILRVKMSNVRNAVESFGAVDLAFLEDVLENDLDLEAEFNLEEKL